MVSDSELHVSLGHRETHAVFLCGTIRVDAEHRAEARRVPVASLLIVNDSFRVDRLRLRLPGVGRRRSPDCMRYWHRQARNEDQDVHLGRTSMEKAAKRLFICLDNRGYEVSSSG